MAPPLPPRLPKCRLTAYVTTGCVGHTSVHSDSGSVCLGVRRVCARVVLNSNRKLLCLGVGGCARVVLNSSSSGNTLDKFDVYSAGRT